MIKCGLTKLIDILSYALFNINKSKSTMNNKKGHKKQRFSDVPNLQERISNETPASGEYFFDYKLEEAMKESEMMNDHEFHSKYKVNFSDLPISYSTSKGLSNRKFTKMTEIQRCVIPHALADRDVIAASRTGSGKTLSYLVPVIQKLYRHKFIPFDGLGAIVIVPVRQLAMQVFQVLNSFTAEMEISVGLITGGKDVKYEKERIRNMNILICTPGRLLQHLEETYGFETQNLQMLILDEADVMLQMGFQETLKSILDSLPKCQRMLFSATLNGKIHLLANLSMNSPERIFLHSAETDTKETSIGNIYETPAKLTQYYMLMKPQQKVNTLYSFLKTHQKEKIIIFVSTCKQVRFLYQSFRKFKMGTPLFELQGHQKQKKRMAIYFTFCEKKYGILLCTNIASRGLDFPMIDWVLQYDIPEDTETYVHRVGRTARFKYEGKGLAFVTEGQKIFIDQIKEKGVKIHKIKQNPQKYYNIQASLQSICSEHQDVKYLAQRALVSYLKFVHKAANKKVFNLKTIKSDKLSESFGLQNAPVITLKNQNQEEDNENEDQPVKKLTKIQKMRLKAEKKKAEKRKKEQEIEEQEEEFEGNQQREYQQQQRQMFKLKKFHKTDPNAKKILTVSKNQLKKVKDHGHFDGKNITHFDDDIKPISDEEFRRKKYEKSAKKQLQETVLNNIEMRLQDHDEEDKQYEKDRRKMRRRKKEDTRQRLKGQMVKNTAVLGDEDIDDEE